jgi:hypothetical protein
VTQQEVVEWAMTRFLSKACNRSEVTCASNTGGVFAAETIERSLADSVAATDGDRIQTFRAIFVERFARDRLAELEGRSAKARRGRA